MFIREILHSQKLNKFSILEFKCSCNLIESLISNFDFKWLFSPLDFINCMNWTRPIYIDSWIHIHTKIKADSWMGIENVHMGVTPFLDRYVCILSIPLVKAIAIVYQNQ